ncbi:MAG TPA: inositol monophosphatase family protein [Mariprofundaceae bacterium]|nr:inositol monophosphatase family protein [Mariprofundaceae bacterium]
MHPGTRHREAVIDVLREAGGRILLPAFSEQAATAATKPDGSVVTETDLLCQAFIRERLHALDPEIRFLGEEMTESEQRACLQQGGLFWCVDPLDGTSNFTASFPCFASTVALIEHGRPVLACTHDPVRDETFDAIEGGGARLNGTVIRASATHAIRQSIGFIDFKRLPAALAGRLAGDRHYRSQRNIGSCALEWAWLAAGRGQFIIHGGEKLWDYAAGCLLVEEAGGIVSDFEGRHPFAASRLTSSIVAGANPKVHAALLAMLGND